MAAANPQAAGQQQRSLRQGEELYLVLYADQVYDGNNARNKGLSTDPSLDIMFGLIAAFDWPIYDGEDTSNLVPVARAQGIQSEMVNGGQCFHTGNIVFEETSGHRGSTIVFTGTSRKTDREGEWAIVGGTGDFTFAQGVIYYKRAKMNITKEKKGEVKRLDIRVRYNRPVQKSELLIHVFGEINPLEVDDGIKGKKPIGTGAYGDVYKATIRDTTVAIKILKHKDLKREKLIIREIEIFKTIRHENLVTLFGACIKKLALIYEFCPNGTLTGRLFSPTSNSSSAAASTTTEDWKPLSWDERVQILGSICSGLKCLHDVDIVHCDLKPSNILFDANNKCKICDFGLARLLKRPSKSMSPIHHTGRMGTQAYVDPVFYKDGTLKRKSDVYALGIIMLQLVTGRVADGLREVVALVRSNGVADDTLKLVEADLDATSKQEALEMIDLALKCSHETNRDDRPDMATVCRKIESMKKSRAITTASGLPTTSQAQT